MHETDRNQPVDRVTLAGSLIAIGIVFGDIGTSPLYTFSAIFGDRVVVREVALGSLSCVFWTLTFQTTLKYVIITLQADNQGEGGIFSLYTLVRRFKRWLIVPAILGGSFLLADGIITPPISVASAIEGLRAFNPQLDTVPIVLVILVGLFAIQQFGTQSIGRIFGPVMVVWFAFIGVIGLLALLRNPGVLGALNPVYAYRLVVEYPGGFWLLGSVFLCTTGAEALYSDMGHCGRGNIRISWVYVKICLILSYAGQCAWLVEHVGSPVGVVKPFFAIVPPGLLAFSIGLATLATVIASQALISGSFTLINEAMRLGLWPRFKVVYPTDFKGQMYVPGINWLFMAGCIGVVLYFKESAHMEAAFGLSVTLTMLMSTVLIGAYLTTLRKNAVLVAFLTVLFFSIEGAFLVANLRKFPEGGWLSVLIGGMLIFVMWVWYRAREVKRRLIEFVPSSSYLPVLQQLSNDASVTKFATHLVYLTASSRPDRIEAKNVYSILQRAPKRADVYWFIHVNVLDEPFAMRYRVEVIVPQDVVWITFNLGFRIEPRINLFFRMVVEEMVAKGEVDITSRYDSLAKNNLTGDFTFVVLENFLSYENDLPPVEKLVMGSYFRLKRFALSDQASYGLDTSNVVVEKVPLVVSPPKSVKLIREESASPVPSEGM
ncbi:MAG: KUP/HAK/KT family potassium transporter [Ferruginibacter sp.]|nr:KUP/HAK/KT family potassium transporter [Cytophagales bacterium]